MANAVTGPAGDTLQRPALPKRFHNLVLKGRGW
jgi:hypothetical protein